MISSLQNFWSAQQGEKRETGERPVQPTCWISHFGETFRSSRNLTTTFVGNCRSHKRWLSVLEEMKPMFDLLKDCHYENKWSKSAPTYWRLQTSSQNEIVLRMWAKPFLHRTSTHIFRRQPHMQMTLLANMVWKEEIPCQTKPCLQAPDHTAEQSVWNLIFPDQQTACYPFIRAEGTHVSLFKQEATARQVWF